LSILFGGVVLQKALVPLNFDVELLQKFDVAEVLIQNAAITLIKEALGLFLPQKAKGHYGFGN
jgi:hypothetical protein